MANWKKVDADVLDGYFSDIADKIREKTGSEALYDPDEMPSGVDEAFEAGKKAEYDEFWDNFQQNGNRVNYWRGFNGAGWNPRTLKPKHIVKPLDSSTSTQYGVEMFYRCNLSAPSNDYIDFSPIADKFDFSEIQRATSLFDSAKFDNVVADLSSAVYANSAFGCTWNAGVRSLKLKVTESLQNVDSMFYNPHLAKIEMMEGSVWAVSVNFGLCPLDKASITSIIGALSLTTTGQSITFSKTAVNKAFETALGAANGSTSAEWLALVGTRSNWTISLV